MTRKRSCDEHVKWVRGCDDCNARSRVYENRRETLAMAGRRLSAPAALTTQRVQSLRAAGYRLTDLAAHCGLQYRHLWVMTNRPQRWVQLRTFHVVQRMYEELSPFPGPSPAAAAAAQRHGWMPPPPLPMPAEIGEDIVDEVAVRRAVDGDQTVTLTRAERTEAWRILESRNLSAREIGRILGTTGRSILRLRAGATRKMHGRSA